MDKTELKNRIVNSLRDQKEIDKIIIFGSFNHTNTPNDIDIAVIQTSKEDYLTLALRYRKLIRNVSKQIAIDIFPIVKGNNSSFYLNEVASGEIIYERRN